MKNLVIAACMFFAIGASAQDSKTAVASTQKVEVVNYADLAKKNAADLAAYIPMTAEKQQIFEQLFNTKFEMLNEVKDLSDERKQVVYNIIERKLEASLDGAEFAKLQSNTKLFNSLTH